MRETRDRPNPDDLEEELRRKDLEIEEARRRVIECKDFLARQEKLAAIGKLAAGIAHEINNPLGLLRSNHATLGNYIRNIEGFLHEATVTREPSISNAAAVWRIEYILADLSQLIKDCDEGFQRITEVVQTLRNYSRVDSEVTHAPFDVNGGITSALILAQNEVKHVADVSLSLVKLPNVECAPGEIMQVLLNIIVNAAQAIKSQGRPAKGRIEIRSGVEQDKIWIEIEDDGPGIPREIQQRIFESFYTTKPAGQAMCLGLSISYDIITRQHGGTLSVRSEPGKGSCFRIEIPLAPGRGEA
jgi:signal transduction histidine kinase